MSRTRVLAGIQTSWINDPRQAYPFDTTEEAEEIRAELDEIQLEVARVGRRATYRVLLEEGRFLIFRAFSGEGGIFLRAWKHGEKE